MKTMIPAVALGAIALLIAGCATTFRPWKLSEVQEGMDRSQVVQILGEPDSVEMKDGAELLHYRYQEDFNPPPSSSAPYDVDPERIFQDLNTEKVFRVYEYAVILVDGKVINYKEL